jgi:methionine sulfoxide reductase catalytic subunit
MDEAMHPLTLMAFGMYGEVLPNQNGAPVRLVVPWKYGFKSAKSDRAHPLRGPAAQDQLGACGAAGVRLLFQREPQGRPPALEPGHRAAHRRVDGLFAKRRPTLMFNGYEPQVASLYAGMDLKRFF